MLTNNFPKFSHFYSFVERNFFDDFWNIKQLNLGNVDAKISVFGLNRKPCSGLTFRSKNYHVDPSFFKIFTFFPLFLSNWRSLTQRTVKYQEWRYGECRRLILPTFLGHLLHFLAYNIKVPIFWILRKAGSRIGVPFP